MTVARRPLGWLAARPALALFLFLVTLYALAAGVSRNSFGYSADGTFAFEMAKSAVVDPEHAYIRDHHRNFSRWGLGLPLLLAPVAAFAEPIAAAAPQRDRIPIGDHDLLLVRFPPVGRGALAEAVSELDLNIQPGRYATIALLSHTGLSAELEQGAEVARLVITDADGRLIERPIRAGIETAEWAYDRAEVRAVVRHERPEPVAKHIGNLRANYYLARWEFDPPVDLASARVYYRAPVGDLYVDGIAMRRPDGAWLDGPGVGRVWSERQNVEFFRRLWAPLVNVIATALGAVILFQIVRRLGYAERAALLVALAYGLGSMAWPYAKLDFSEPIVTTALLGVVWALLLQRHTGLVRFAALAGLVAVFAVFTKYVTAIALPPLAIYVIVQHKPGRSWRQTWQAARRPLLAFLLPFLVLAPLVLLVAALAFDMRLLYERELIGGLQRDWLELPFLLGFHGLVTSWGKGVLWYNPVLLLAIPAIPWFIHRHGWRSLIFLAVPIVYLALYSKKPVWYGGNAWGPRYLVPTLPFLIVMGAPLAAWAVERARRLLPRLALAALLLASVGVQFMGVSKDFIGYLNLFQFQVAGLVSENGAIYGGAEYQRWSSIQPEGDFAAVLYAHQFSPLLAHAWLLRADAVNLFAPDRTDLLEDALYRSPWSRFGIDAPPRRPEAGLGLDFWSMTLAESFLAYPWLVFWIAAALLGLQALSLGAWGVVTRRVLRVGGRWRLVQMVPVGAYAAVLVVFDTAHFML